jgi:uncharacterized phage protein (TIGR02216 family)
MAFGLGVLKLAPAAFWAMTLREIAAVVSGMAAARDGIGRGALDEMMRRFPD